MFHHTFPWIQEAYDYSVSSQLFDSRTCMDSDKRFNVISA